MGCSGSFAGQNELRLDIRACEDATMVCQRGCPIPEIHPRRRRRGAAKGLTTILERDSSAPTTTRQHYAGGGDGRKRFIRADEDAATI
jgi:hypothetical protein